MLKIFIGLGVGIVVGVVFGYSYAELKIKSDIIANASKMACTTGYSDVTEASNCASTITPADIIMLPRNRYTKIIEMLQKCEEYING